ncbi:MAG: cytochrome c oxidase accessory protein CcoG [Bacteroidia bacterium]|nr:cytochrome c oxidase accessory protein CcoG [Bacteroidia bacterium]
MSYNDDVGDIYRDKLATVDKSGKRIWIYPKKPKGRFYDYRKWVSYFLLIVLFGMPFVKVNGQPFMLFNIPEAKFILFGIYFSPQDFHLFVIAMLISILFIVLFTVVYGRLFCGWVCPQTIFMEMVFRRIEYWIEGDANAQKRLNKAPWNEQKILKKGAKHALFILISVLIAHTFLSYIIGVDEVWRIISEPIGQHWKGFVAMVIFTIVFYGVFSILREQVCTTICPYGRLQGVMLDENSLAVAYDFVRGEPRGKIRKKAAPEETPKGDCVDCGLCVKVCPTGIDIRNGTQLECVNCTACMDACDEVMTKVNRPQGLIRIDSYNGIKEGSKSMFNTRVIAYSIVLLALIGLESFLFASRSSVETLFLRTPGMLYQDNDDGYISNLYNYQLINKTTEEVKVTFEIQDMEGVLFQAIGQQPQTLSETTSEGAIFIKIPKEQLKDRKTRLKINVIGEDGTLIDETTTSFLGPVQ